MFYRLLLIPQKIILFQKRVLQRLFKRQIKSRWPYAVITLSLSIFLALSIAEGYYRYRHGMLDVRGPGIFALSLEDGIHQRSNDPELLWELVPGGKGMLQGKQIAINSIGARSPEIPMTKAEGAKRIVALGDSITFGAGVSQDENFCSQLEKMLRKKTGKAVDVINGGVSGYNAHQEATAFFKKFARYHPDLILVNFFNDDMEETYSLKPPGLADKLEYYSLLFRSVRWHTRRALGKISGMNPWWENYSAEAVAQAYKDYERLNAWTCENHAHILFVIHPDFRDEGKSKQAAELVNWLSKKEIPYLVVRDVYRAHMQKHEVEFSNSMKNFDPHPNPEGHKLIAAAIVDRIETEGFLADE